MYVYLLCVHIPTLLFAFVSATPVARAEGGGGRRPRRLTKDVDRFNDLDLGAIYVNRIVLTLIIA